MPDESSSDRSLFVKNLSSRIRLGTKIIDSVLLRPFFQGVAVINRDRFPSANQPPGYYSGYWILGRRAVWILVGYWILGREAAWILADTGY